jgi:thiamine kinase-like enzyme
MIKRRVTVESPPTDSHEDRIAQLPCWPGKVEVSPLSGGMTNRNYRVSSGGGDYVVRIGRDLPEHGVMRFNELAAARAAHTAGISPEVVYAADGVMVSRFIHGRTLTDADVRRPQMLTPLMDLVRRCHRDIPRHLRGPALTFWVFQVIRNYAAVLREVPVNPLAGRMAGLITMAQQLEQAIGPIDLVFGHNDLLAANFMDDGQRLWLIDWDYAGFNSPLFDLANLASNNGFSAEQHEELLARYFGVAADGQRRRAFAAMKSASLLREVLWGAVSQVKSTIDFDYAAYTAEYLARLDGETCQRKLNQA